MPSRDDIRRERGSAFPLEEVARSVMANAVLAADSAAGSYRACRLCDAHWRADETAAHTKTCAVVRLQWAIEAEFDRAKLQSEHEGIENRHDLVHAIDCALSVDGVRVTNGDYAVKIMRLPKGLGE